ncbi:hypothetical protein SGRIM128S_06433 [Streptomyces griseomycini]
MLTLWLHGDPAADAGTGHPAATDLLVPLAPAPPGIAAHRPHRVAELLPVLTLRLAPARTAFPRLTPPRSGLRAPPPGTPRGGARPFPCLARRASRLAPLVRAPKGSYEPEDLPAPPDQPHRAMPNHPK